MSTFPPAVMSVAHQLDMDGEHLPYIFGSFSRRRQCDDVKAPKRRSLDQLPGQSASSSTSSVVTTTVQTPQRRNPRMSEKQNQEFQCGLCQHQVCEPRVLPCLHTFCTACLQRLETEAGPRDIWDDETGSLRDGGAGSTGSGGSGYESGGGGSWTAIISCPRCGEEYRGNITSLPPNYVLQHRLVLASLNRETTRILCDLCSTDVPASCRCTACLLSLCTFCAEAHSRQRVTAGHEVLPLHEAKQRGISCVRRQVMCPLHPELELTLFCNACSQVACRECCLLVHRGHSCETAPRAAQLYVRSLRDSLDRARPMADDAVVSLDRLRRLNQRIQARCSEVQVEVDQFIDAYIAALEEHRRTLQIQVQEQREAKLHAIRTQQQRLERLADETRTAVSFAEDLLTEGSDVELLSLVVPVLRRLEWCCSSAGGGSSCLLEPRVSDCLQFLPNESAGKVKDYSLYGVITTQSVSPPHCTLDIDALMDCRQHRKAETLMITRDADEQPLCHGGEKVVAELRYRDASRRQIPVQVSDRRDGTYLISFIPDTAGNLNLSVSVRGKPIQGSPFHVCVRTLRPHQGTFHCCSFCSSGGNKEASCGCGGTMPGGYKGCGHGHTGHPGRRHWSCCGNILQNSECGRANSAVYQFTL